MAIGSFILHGSRKRVGNLVTYKRDGKQVVREKAAAVANPRTIGQAKQRALFAPVAKFYSPLSVVLEQSFEGLSKSQSYSRFLKENLKLSRNNGWYLPKGFAWFPMPYIVSKGTIRPVLYDMDDQANAIRLMDTDALYSVSLTTIGGISQVFLSLGYQAGDQITVIAAKTDGANVDFNANFWPEFVRFIIAPDSTEPANFDGFEFAFISGVGVIIRSNDQYVIVGGAIIVSRFQNGMWRRSSSMMDLVKKVLKWLRDWIKDERAIASYRDGTGDIQSDVYLNGSKVAAGMAGAGSSIHLVDGSSFTPRSLVIVQDGPDAYAYVAGTIGLVNTKRALVKLGDTYLLTKTTKGALPSSIVVSDFALIDGTQPEMKAWLTYNGVAQSVF